MQFASYEQALPALAKQLPRPEPIRTVKSPGDKVLINPAIERWRAEHPELVREKARG